MMNTFVQSRHYYAMVLLALALFIGQMTTVAVAQASTGISVMEQKDPNCRIKVMAGWRPYRVQASDSLLVLAERADVTVDAIMQINCLTITEINADDLVLVPTLRAAGASVQKTEQQVVPAAVEEAAPAISVAQLLTIISTTTDITASKGVTEGTELSQAIASPSSGGGVDVTLPGPPSTPFTSSNIVLFSLFVMGTLGMLFFALRPRQGDSPVIYKLFRLLGNALFLFAGVLIGVFLFPAMQAPSFATLPTSVNVALVVMLIGMLAVKELFFSGQQWRTASRLLNFGIVPLLMIFFLTVATRVAALVN